MLFFFKINYHTVVVSFSRLNALSQPSWLIADSSFSTCEDDDSGSARLKSIHFIKKY